MSITDELRKVAAKTECANGRCEKLYRGDLEHIADRIDAEHERAMADAYLSGTPTDEKLTELGWVRKSKEHVVSHATIEVTPHIDWSRMADELNEFVEIVRGNGLKLRRTQMQFTDEQQRFIDEHYQLLPKDADGEYIHVGDEMCGYGWPNGGVYCRAIVNEVTILVGPQDGAYRGWLMWAANECRQGRVSMEQGG